MKYLCLIHKRPELSHKAFQDYYEHCHAPLAQTFSPPTLYQRNYPLTEQDFSCITEFDYPDDYDLLAAFNSEAAPILAADEAEFIDRSRTIMARALPVLSTEPARLAVRQRSFWLLKDALSEQALAALEGQKVSVYSLEPCFCESFPYQMLVLSETPNAELPALASATQALYLPMNSYPSLG